MKTVYVFSSFLPFQPEHIEVVSTTRKAGEKALRMQFPHMKATGDDTYILDAKVRVLGKEQKLLGKVREYTMVE